jgi:hypothetical protein
LEESKQNQEEDVKKFFKSLLRAVTQREEQVLEELRASFLTQFEALRIHKEEMENQHALIFSLFDVLSTLSNSSDYTILGNVGLTSSYHRTTEPYQEEHAANFEAIFKTTVDFVQPTIGTQHHHQNDTRNRFPSEY